MRLAFCLGNAEESDSLLATVVKAAVPRCAVVCFKDIYPPPPPTPPPLHMYKCHLVLDVAPVLLRKAV